MTPEIIAELTAQTTTAVEWHVAQATDATPTTPWLSRTPEQRASLLAGALADIAAHPITESDTVESLDAALRVALVRRIAAGFAT